MISQPYFHLKLRVVLHLVEYIPIALQRQRSWSNRKAHNKKLWRKIKNFICRRTNSSFRRPNNMSWIIHHHRHRRSCEWAKRHKLPTKDKTILPHQSSSCPSERSHQWGKHRHLLRSRPWSTPEREIEMITFSAEMEDTKLTPKTSKTDNDRWRRFHQSRSLIATRGLVKSRLVAQLIGWSWQA